MSQEIINSKSDVELITEIQEISDKYKLRNYINTPLTDLTHLKTFTIDDKDTIEVDDAISIEKISERYKLWIHIASPASHFKYDSPLDRRARRLISTQYLTSSTIYMLPEVLIKEIFSLSNKDKRDSLSLGVVLNNDGTIYSSEIVQSLIKPTYRLSYDDADELIDYAPKEEEELYLISMMLNKRKSLRMKSGAKEILEAYAKIKIKDDIPILKIIYPTLSRQLISEAMILYGELMSNYTRINKIPVPYRVQESLGKVIKNDFPDSNTVLNNFILKKNMGKTFYSSNPLRHESLGLKSYLHATSPIRRYADLLVHFQIYRYLNNEELIPRNEIERNIQDINNLGRQNISRYRQDQKNGINKWFENNKFNDYRVILLNWVNRNKMICILYFVEYKFSSICLLRSKTEPKVGDKINIKNITNDYSDILCFQLFSE